MSPTERLANLVIALQGFLYEGGTIEYLGKNLEQEGSFKVLLKFRNQFMQGDSFHPIGALQGALAAIATKTKLESQWANIARGFFF